jgi:phosphoribosylformylglycinamidine cyclo-ligase
MSERGKRGVTYREAGVDIDAGDALVERIKPLVRRTFRPEVMGDLGGFGGLFRLPTGYKEPVLVSGTDGVGTKLKVAFATGHHDTIGIDLVAMCVNDIAVCGAEPLFFLDYFASGHLDVDVGEAIVRGIADGCREAGCALIGGETAELPGMYPHGEYDLAGFAVGVVEKSAILDGAHIVPGDRVLGLPSSGLHSNGYSLAREVLLERAKLPLAQIADDLMRPTRIYVRQLRAAIAAGGVRGCAHITGGGLYDNPPRVLRPGLGIRLHPERWPLPPVIQRIAELGPVDDVELRRTFNCGLGMLIVVERARFDAVRDALTALGEHVYDVGEVFAAPDGSAEPYVEFA